MMDHIHTVIMLPVLITPLLWCCYHSYQMDHLLWGWYVLSFPLSLSFSHTLSSNFWSLLFFSLSLSLSPSIPPFSFPLPLPSLSLLQELITALHGLILQYEREFQIAALRSSDSDSSLVPSNLSTSLTPGGWINVFIDPSSSSSSTDAEKRSDHLSPMKRSPVALSNGSVNSESYSSGEEEESPPRPGPRTQSFAPPPSIIRYHDNSSSSGLYAQIWRGVQSICSDPCPKVALKAGSIIQCVHDKVWLKIRAAM